MPRLFTREKADWQTYLCWAVTVALIIFTDTQIGWSSYLFGR
jgi:hypothetical protein